MPRHPPPSVSGAEAINCLLADNLGGGGETKMAAGVAYFLGMELGWAGGMHAMSFLQKRGHLSAVALGRKMFAAVPPMTPARFDLMHVIYDNTRNCPLAAIDGMIPQAQLTRRLGLARQTVSKMLKRLFELGLIDRYRCSGDARRMLVGLTDEGIALIEHAYGRAFTERYPPPPKADGSPPTRKDYRRAREQALVQEKIAKVYASLERKGRGVQHDPRGLLPPVPQRPPKEGREVARVFMTLAWKRAGGPHFQKRLDALQAMLVESYSLTTALGDTSELIYSTPRPLGKKRPKDPWYAELVAAWKQRRAQRPPRSTPPKPRLTVASSPNAPEETAHALH